MTSSKKPEKRAAFCLIYCYVTKRFLFEYRADWVGNPNTWGLFGGGVDKDEKYYQAVLRELLEETQWVPPHGLSYGTLGVFGKSVGLFVALTDTEFEPVLSPESESFRWVTDVAELKPLHPRILKRYGAFRKMMQACRAAGREFIKED